MLHVFCKLQIIVKTANKQSYLVHTVLPVEVLQIIYHSI